MSIAMTVASENFLPVFDEIIFLKRHLNDLTLAREVVQLFLAKTPHYIGKITTCLVERDADGLHRHAHTLKGSAATLGAVRLAALAAELMALGMSNDLDGAEEKLSRLIEENEALLRVLAERGWIGKR